MSDLPAHPPPAARPAGNPLTAEQEAQLFWRMRCRWLVNTMVQNLRQSRLRVVSALALSTLLWLGLFELFSRGFQFLIATIQHPDTQAQTVGAVYRVFFVSLMVMLLFSTAIILYGGLFRSREVRFLLTMPARTERLFVHKLQEAVFVSSWGFVLLGSPLLIAYGIVTLAPWYYYALLIPYTLAFVYIPGSLGAIACLLVMSIFPRRRRHVLMLAGAITIAAIVWTVWSSSAGVRGSMLTPLWFHDALARLKFSEHKLLPSWWLSTGLLQTARGRWPEGVLFLSLTISNALLLHQAAVWLARRRLRKIFSDSAGGSGTRGRVRAALVDGAILRGAFGLPCSVRLLLVNDLRRFRRDPSQWTQFLIFFGLLAMYFLNTRWIRADSEQVVWITMISFLNLGVIGLILSTYTTRIIFPMISLEGRRFWILGLLPVKRDAILWGKFLFAFGGMLLPCCLLAYLSDLMLHVPPILMGLHLLLSIVLCAGLSGIAVGLGATMPNFKEESPAKIAAGFGGTLNLVTSAGFIAVAVLLMAVPAHFWIAETADIGGEAATSWMPDARLVAGAAGSLAFGIVATLAPLWWGLRRFRELEL